MNAQLIKLAALRRQALAKKIGEGLVIITASPEAIKSKDIYYHPYFPNNYLYYFTGCREAHTALVLMVCKGQLKEAIFFCRHADKNKMQWDGTYLTPTVAKKKLGIDSTDITHFEKTLSEKAKSVPRIFCLPGMNQALDRLVIELITQYRTNNRRGVIGPTSIVDLSSIVDDMRLIKEKEEIDAIRKACLITCDGIQAAMRVAPKARNECEVDAAIIHRYRLSRGYHAFPPIVASGHRACVLHYMNNNEKIKRDSLLLVDTGCEIDGYCGDITRTFPANGKWHGMQETVYNIVLSAQQAAIACVKPGVTWSSLEEVALKELITGLQSLGLCRGTTQTIMKKGLYRRFYMHRIGHWLGLDVHDVGREQEGQSQKLKTGMVLTIEPGLYIPNDRDIPPPLRGIGIRIEDDILVTKTGHENLTITAPKKTDDIQAWMLN